MFRLHRLNGRVAFCLLVAHFVFILAARIVTTIRFDTPVFVSGEMLTIVLGAIALVLMTVAIGLTLYGRLNHEMFVYVHRGLGFAFMIAALHVFRTPGTKAASTTLTYYLIVLFVLGTAAFIYRSLAGESLVPRLDYRVKNVRQLDQSVTEISMVPEDQVLTHAPGQFLFVEFFSDGLKEHFHAVELHAEGASAVVELRPGAISHQAHPFSIASAPQDPELKIAVKALGDFTNALRFLEEGAFARIEGPFGGFSYLNHENRKQVWIAGGIGITPFLSMARHLRSDDYQIDFFYAMERGDQGYFLDELYEIADRYPRMRVVPIVKDKLGHITAEDVAGVTKNLPEKEILICGPPPMMKALETQFLAMGVPGKQIHYENFAFAG
jgi:predicted ferric reductase